MSLNACQEDMSTTMEARGQHFDMWAQALWKPNQLDPTCQKAWQFVVTDYQYIEKGEVIF